MSSSISTLVYLAVLALGLGQVAECGLFKKWNDCSKLDDTHPFKEINTYMLAHNKGFDCEANSHMVYDWYKQLSAVQSCRNSNIIRALERLTKLYRSFWHDSKLCGREALQLLDSHSVELEENPLYQEDSRQFKSKDRIKLVYSCWFAKRAGECKDSKLEQFSRMLRQMDQDQLEYVRHTVGSVLINMVQQNEDRDQKYSFSKADYRQSHTINVTGEAALEQIVAGIESIESDDGLSAPNNLATTEQQLDKFVLKPCENFVDKFSGRFTVNLATFNRFELDLMPSILHWSEYLFNWSMHNVCYRLLQATSTTDEKRDLIERVQKLVASRHR